MNVGRSRVVRILRLHVLILLHVSGCSGRQSALAPAGRGAQEISTLFWLMLVVGTMIWLGMIGLAIYSVRRDVTHNSRSVRFWIIGGGAVMPTALLSLLMVYSIPMIPRLLEPAPEDALTIEVRGKMWWWRVRYLGPHLPAGQPIELANEIRLPVGQPVEFKLGSDDVIHAFWIPSLGGKVDMIPGRTTRLRLEPTKTGIFRGACAEYCGDSHALMNFDVIVMPRDDFAEWLEHQSQEAAPPHGEQTIRGKALFLQYGCHACHAMRGTEARGTVGPDLTHVGSRVSLVAGAMRNGHADYIKWIKDPQSAKPGAKMPAFGMLPDDEIEAITAYLESLQ